MSNWDRFRHAEPVSTGVAILVTLVAYSLVGVALGTGVMGVFAFLLWDASVFSWDGVRFSAVVGLILGVSAIVTYLLE